MPRSLRYVLFALGLLAAATIVGIARPSSAQVVPSTDAAPPAPKETAPPSYPEINEAIEHFKVRDFDGAVALLEKAVARYPDLPPAQVMMFQLFVQAQQPYLARMALEKAVITAPNDPEPFVILANAALQERRVTEADLLFNKASKMLDSFSSSKKRKDILDPQTVSGLAAVAEAREKWPEAEGYLSTLLKLNPKDTLAMQRMARAKFQQKDAKGALEKLREAKTADGTNDTVLTPEAALARFYQQFGDPANAKKWMNNALRAAPGDLRTRLVAAQMALEMGDIDEAKTQSIKALDINQRSLDAKVLRGVVALFQKDFKTAETWFQDAHLQSPSYFPATNNLALALCEQTDDPSKMQRALEYATTNYQNNSKNPDAASTLGWVFYKRKDYDRAELALRQAAQTGNLSADTAYYLAQLYYTRNNKPDAKTLLDFILKSDHPFSMRKEATELAEKVKAEMAAAPAKKP